MTGDPHISPQTAAVLHAFLRAKMLGDTEWGKAVMAELPDIAADRRRSWVLGGLWFLLRRRPAALTAAVVAAVSAALLNGVSAIAILTRSRAALEADLADQIGDWPLPAQTESGQAAAKSEMVASAYDATATNLTSDARFAVAIAIVTLLVALLAFRRWTALPLLLLISALLANTSSAVLQVVELEVTPVLSGICGQLAIAIGILGCALIVAQMIRNLMHGKKPDPTVTA